MAITGVVTLKTPVESPEDYKDLVHTKVIDEGVANSSILLQHVDVDNMRFELSCDDTDENYQKMLVLCGTLNTTRPGIVTLPQPVRPGPPGPGIDPRPQRDGNPRSVPPGEIGNSLPVRRSVPRPDGEPFQIAGSEGQFAKDHPPPPDAKYGDNQ